jgi:hypothetical protein
MRKIAMAMACLAALWGGRAVADDDEVAPEHRHDGFYLHAGLGLGGMESRAGATGTSEEARLSGVGMAFNLALGWSLGDHWAIGGEVWDMVVPQPDVRVGSTTTGSDSDSDVTLTGWGPTVRFYIAPEHLNMFLAATPSITQVTTRLNGVDGSTRNGLGLRLSVGKEWWLGRTQWGIGVAGHLVLSGNKDSGRSDAPTWSTTGAGIDFSATWN